MNLNQIREEVTKRGFDFVSPTSRIDTWINLAYRDICSREAWPFLEDTATGSAPITFPQDSTEEGVFQILSVVNTTNPAVIEWEDVRTLREDDPTLSTTGTPENWYLENGTYPDVHLKAYPTNSDTLSVSYIKIPAALSADADIPLLPSTYHYSLVEGALVEAYRDSDNYEAADRYEARFENWIQKMGNAILSPSGHGWITPSPFGSSDW